LGVRFPKGRSLRLRSASNLESIFGEGFAATIEAAEVGEWILVESTHGWHVVELVSRHEGRSPSFAGIRQQLALDYEAEQRQAYVDRQVERLRSEYEVELPDGSLVEADEPSLGSGD
jgi:parvulin-like peptidyl-prolyl isomerase